MKSLDNGSLGKLDAAKNKARSDEVEDCSGSARAGGDECRMLCHIVTPYLHSNSWIIITALTVLSHDWPVPSQRSRYSSFFAEFQDAELPLRLQQLTDCDPQKML